MNEPHSERPKSGFVHLLFEQILPKVETLALLVTLSGIALWIAGFGDYRSVLMVGMVTLAGIYFLYVYQPPQGEEPGAIGKLAVKLLHVSAAVAAIGVLFTLLPLEGAPPMLAVGAASSVLATGLTVYALLTATGSKNALRAGLLRTLMITCLASYVFVTTQQLWR
ncbi:MAG: hypothetical protein MUC38_07875 [Cyclobacteriaceae bacterium]|jgi:hypothetical protein|nr:hypothetical protein [Cyclobacteriaceae bacterium]